MIEFVSANILNTTTMITVNSNTSTASNLFNRDPLYQYYSSGLNNDATTSTITIAFGSTTPVSRIALLGINYKEFRIYYNGATANTFSLSNADTTVSNYTTNADEDKYFRFSTIQCTSITIDAKTTQTVNQEKVISLLNISDLQLELTQTPSAQAYKPKIQPKQIVHKLSDGGTRIHNVRKKWEVAFSLDYVSESQRDSLLEIYNSESEINFCPFGTATGWDGIFFEAVWDGSFPFYEYSDNAASSGFSGKVSLKETPI